ncbi:MAG: family 20 glycosylhydrolase [Bacteroidales bacterium]
MRKTFLIAFALFLITNLSAKKLPSEFQLLPAPQSLQVLSGKSIMGTDLTYILAENCSVPVLGPLMERLPRAKKTGKGIILRITDSNTPDSPEGYFMEVTTRGVIISSKSEKGIFYGCQTLEQLLEDSRDFNVSIPPIQITDYPKIAFRAVHFDNKHHLDRIEYYYKAIDKLARYKINAVIWEIEDKLRYTRRPEIGASNAISKQEMQALCKYAKERNIEINPLVQGLGHAGFILKHHWNLRENPNSDWEFCPSDPRTYELQFDLYRDAIEAMPDGRYLHIGGDEITAIGIDERCKATGKTAFELQMIWLKKVCDFASQHNRIPIFWDDMPLKYSGIMNVISNNPIEANLDAVFNTQKLDEAIELFPKECIYMRWEYGDATKPAHQRLLKWYKDKGLKVMGATGAAIGASFMMPRLNSRSAYIKGFNELVAENQLEGILATSWDDGSPHFETVWRGFIAQGEYGWNPDTRSIEEFMAAHAQREFGFGADDNKLGFLNTLEKSIFLFDGALVTSGRRNPTWGVTNFTLVELPDAKTPGEWSKRYAQKLNDARQTALYYEEISTGIRRAKNEALRNRYTLEIYEQINELQYYPARLLLALSKYDTAEGDNARKEALDTILQICNSFSPLKEQLITVFGKTRFMSNPSGYIADLNHHNHLAAKTQNSDWIFLYEIPMTKKVYDWVIAQ